MSSSSAFRFAGIATLSSPLPTDFRIPRIEQDRRLAIFSVLPANASEVVAIAGGLDKLGAAGYPVTSIMASKSGELADGDLAKFAGWIDALDRR
jgi:hypothetical protein